jgi:predicted component of type VI protein secretion system
MKLLFERLQQDAGSFDTEQAVLDNLRLLVSSRVMPAQDPGNGDFEASGKDAAAFDVLNCGVGSVVELGGSLALERYIARLRALIAHYEPRLRDPCVVLAARLGAEAAGLVVAGGLETAQGLQTLRFPVPSRAGG